MSLMALGINPREGSVDYISEIEKQYKNGQFGDPALFNDDIFAIIVLRRAGISESDERILNAAKFIQSFQKDSGAWQSPDLTAAAIQALLLVPATENQKTDIQKGMNYLKSVQFDDGGFGDVFATSWVTQAIVAMGEDPVDPSNGNI